MTTAPVESGALRVSFDDDPPREVAEALSRLAALARADASVVASATAAQRGRFEVPLRVHEALGRLRDAAQSPAELVAAAPRLVCEACGFSRSLISRVHGSRWKPDMVWSDPAVVGREVRESFERYVKETEIGLEHLLLETDLVRRRRPALVSHPLEDERTFKGIIVASSTDGYVVAPILPTGKVIGFLHADRLGQGRSVDAHDRENLWMFAEHFGLLFERLVLVGRLEQQRVRLKSALREAGRHVDEACSAEIELARGEPVVPSPQRRPGGSAPRQLAGLLTVRETEVLELVADGRSNGEIARVLVVSEATVKSHLARLLRKLQASTRAEAVARYLNRLDDAGR
jgi:DNA-binding CsgD family transcriptional regulator/GAF domain-containing protein